MAQLNSRNSFSLLGNAARVPYIADNKDGSHSVRLTLGVRDNYRSTDANGQKAYQSQFIEVARYIPNNDFGARLLKLIQNIEQGELLSVAGHLENTTFTDKNGQVHYETRVVADDIDTFVESKAARLARENNAAARKQQPATAPAATGDMSANAPY